MENVKNLTSRPSGCLPDLIIHKITNNYNLLLIECRGLWILNSTINEDCIII